MRIQISSGLHWLSVLWLTILQWPWMKISEWCVLGFLSLAVLWRGGKSLDATWFLVGVSWLCTVVWWWKERQNMKSGPSEANRDISLFLWSCVMLMMVWTVLSYHYSTTQNYGLDEVLRTGALGFLFLWSVRIFSQKNGAQISIFRSRIFQCITLVTFIACILGLFIYVFQPVNRFVGTFFDYRFHTDYWPNAWAEYLLLVWPIVFLYFHTNRMHVILSSILRQSSGQTPDEMPSFSKKMSWFVGLTMTFYKKYSHFLTLGFVIGCLFLSFSRGAMIAFGGQLVLWFVLSFYPLSLTLPPRGREGFVIPWKTIVTNAGVVLGTALIVFFVANIVRGSRFDIEDPWDKVTFDSAEGSSSVSERALFWKQAISLAWQKPLFGWGPYSFRFVQPHIQEGVLATSDHPHNVFLKLAMEQGWVAAILFGIVVGLVLWKGFRKVVGGEGKMKSEQTQEAILFLVSICGVLAHNLIDYNIQFVGIASIFWIVLALLYAICRSTSPVSYYTSDRAIRSVEVAGVSLLLLVAVFEGRFLLLSSLGRHAEARNETERALFWYNAAEGEWFSRDLHLSRIQLLLNKGALPEASIAINNYLKVDEDDHRIWKMKGDFYLQRREFDEALMAYERAYIYGKYNDLGPMLGIIDVYLKKQEWFALKNRLPEFEKLLEEYAYAIERNTHFIALSRTVEDFLMIADRLGKAFPDDGPRYQVLGARVDRHAGIEREKFRARPLGRLW